MMSSSTSRAWALGGSTFAGCMMVMLGFWQVMVGIAAIAKGGFFVTNGEYLYEFDTTTWGWIHLVVGALSLVAGIFIFTDAAWARGVGIALAIVSATTQFFWLPYQPLWSLAVIALDVFVIWSLVSVGGAIRDERAAEARAGTRSWSDVHGGGDPMAANPARSAQDTTMGATAEARERAARATGQDPPAR